MALSRPFTEDRLALLLPLLQAINGVMSLALCPQVVSQVSQVPQHSRSSEKQAISEGCFVCQCICSVIFLSPRHVQGGTPTGGFESGCRPRDYELTDLRDYLPKGLLFTYFNNCFFGEFIHRETETDRDRETER